MSGSSMPGSSSRRRFLKGLSTTGAALPFLRPALGSIAAFADSRISNEFLEASFDTGTGRLGVRRTGGAVLLSGATVRVNTPEGLRSSAGGSYRHETETVPFEDALGRGNRLVVRSIDRDRRLDLELGIDLYDGRNAVFVEATCRNRSSEAIVVDRVEPLSAVEGDGGALHWPGVTRILTNGPMYYDPGVVADFGPGAAEARRSWWNIGFFRGYEREGLVCGHVTNDVALGQLVARPSGADRISLGAESILAKRFLLQAGSEVRSNRFVLGIAPDPYAALESYAQVLGTLGKARIRSVLNGWCDWFYAFEYITEDEVIRNAEFAARVLRPYGLEYIQVDEGFQRWHGDWEGNERFPHGMKWLADRIRSLGLKPGIWLAPYVISEPARVFQEHPEWFLRNADGGPKRVGPWPSEDSDWARGEKVKRYGLDITHPGAADWASRLFCTVAREWGYELIKIDFVDWSLLSADRYHDPKATRASAYRKGFEILREAVGPDCHLLDCGPGPVTVGLLDSMRIELDQPPVRWKQYFVGRASSAPAAAKRYYFHKRAWINDADHVCLNLLPPSQAQAAATLLALSGGNLLSGDRLPDLDATRLEILKKVFPSSGEAARPVDLFDTDQHSVFALEIRRPFGTWTIVGVFNTSETTPEERTLPLGRLWLDPAKTYLAYDFWKERFLGEVSRELRLSLPPASVTLLSLREKLGIPQVVGTDRHVLQGAIELEGTTWNPRTKTLSGVSLGPENTAHDLAVYIPQARPWVQGGPYLYRDFDGYTLKMLEDHILRVRVRFDRAPRVAWEVRLEEVLG